MAVVVDVKSSYKGEQKVRNTIEEFFTDDTVVYNNREVNGREYDICLLVKDVCVFIVEVKGWLASKIKVHGVDEIEVEGYEEWQTSPKKQAKSYCIQCSFSYRLQICQPRKPYKPLKPLTGLECL